nr:hypothetical protein [Tanacetum cinerariifolium]
ISNYEQVERDEDWTYVEMSKQACSAAWSIKSRPARPSVINVAVVAAVTM